MNNFNLALQIDEHNRLLADEAAIEAEADRECDLNILGGSHAAFGIDPEYPESEAYWLGYQLQARKTWIQRKAAQRAIANGISCQGYLLSGYSALKRKYGKIKPLGTELDYKGWAIRINGNEPYIEIATLDWEDAKSEIKWMIYSSHPDALKLLAEEWGVENVINLIECF